MHLQCLIDSSEPSPIMVIGDLNVALPNKIALNRTWHKRHPFNAHGLLMYDFIVDNELLVANFAFPQQVNHTYHKGRDKTYIDHVLVSKFLDVSNCNIMPDITDNVSDHYPLLTDITLKYANKQHISDVITNKDNTIRINWSDPMIKRNYSSYINEASTHINPISGHVIQSHDDALSAVNRLCSELSTVFI